MAAPGWTYQKNGGGKEDGHKESLGAEKRSGHNHGWNGNMERPRHKELIHSEQPDQKLGEKNEGKENPDAEPPPWGLQWIKHFSCYKSCIQRQGKDLEPAPSGDKTFNYKHRPGNPQLDETQERGGQEKDNGLEKNRFCDGLQRLLFTKHCFKFRLNRHYRKLNSKLPQILWLEGQEVFLE
jgi:hypothetical protein